MKRSTDAGETWGNLTLINQWPVFAEEVKFGNPTALFDNQTGKLFLTYTNNTELNNGYRLFYRVSENGGLNWSEPLRLSDTVKGIFGPGHGIQMTRGSYAGRLIVPTYSSAGCFAMYSDDNGETWLMGGTAGYGNECEILELENGTLHMLLRTNVSLGTNHPPQHALYALSSDGGITWTEVLEHSEIPTPIVMGSIARVSSLAEHGTNRIIISYPGSYRSRVRITLYMSYDESETWTEEKILYYGPSGYSELASLSDGSIICLFEYGRVQYSDKIAFVKCDVSWLTDEADTFSG
jgi:sialidase-1